MPLRVFTRRALPTTTLCLVTLGVVACEPPGNELTAQTTPDTGETGAGSTNGAQTPPAQTPVASSAGKLGAYTAGITGAGKLIATLETTAGTIECVLHERRAPRTVANFIGLARGLKVWVDPESGEGTSGKKFYDGTIFHRVIPGFAIQGGDPTGTGRGGPGFRIMDETHAALKHDRPGVLSMANAGPNTAGSQFFILEAPAPHLDGRHAVFGQCANLDVVKSIARAPADAMNRPKAPPMLRHVTFRRGQLGVPAHLPSPKRAVKLRALPPGIKPASPGDVSTARPPKDLPPPKLPLPKLKNP